MADDSDGSPAVIPTAVNIETEFPHPKQDRSDRSSLKSTATDGGTPLNVLPNNHAPQNESNKLSETNRTSSFSRIETARDLSPPPRPWIKKSATELPQSSRRHSLVGRARSGSHRRKPPQFGRQATLTFDPYSSDSSSSDDEEPASLRRSSTEQSRLAREERNRREGSPGAFSRFRIANEHFRTKGRVSKRDGRLRLNIQETVNSGYFAKTLGAGLRKHFKRGDDTQSLESYDGRDIDVKKIAPEDDEMEHNPRRRVKLNVAIIVIGSRGDIQPFLKIGKILKEDYGHRVRIATHPVFKKFVEEDSGLEFFSVGGDPSELMAFMVKNPGLIPNYETIREGEIGKRRAAMYEMFQGMWRACINSTDDEDDKANLKMMGNKLPFIADAIIANPPSFAPPHIAERLGIPLHMMFTFPYTPTVQFPHPLANIKASNVDAKYTNFMSYPLVELMTWQGLGDLVNRFRNKTLGLEEVSTLWAPGNLYRLRVPYTYMWSPGLVPKPQDWGPEIDISGFVFLDLASSFKPPEELTKFLDSGPPPVYIGFGSIVVDDPDQFTKLIFEAVKLAGVRALVSKGWGGFGSNETSPDNIFMLDNTPHDWLFPRVSAVVHHGGAGTTAIGLKCGRPTMIVPFFGDQPFWGAMVAKAKAGAHDCIPYKKLTAERLAEGIKQCLTEEAKVNVQKIADSIAKEGDGASNAVRSFHRSLPLKGECCMRCDILENRPAAWKFKGTNVRLSAIAAELLVEWKKIKWNELRLTRHYEWNDFGGPGEPFTGTWGAIVSTASDIAASLGYVPIEMAKSVKRREKYYEKKYRVRKRQKYVKKTLAKANAESPHDGAAKGTFKKENQNGQSVSSLQRARTISDTPEPEGLLAQELAQEAKLGVGKTAGAIFRLPVRFSLALVQGFHNAPRLYGDETVRRPPRITGLHSGVRAGRDEFVYGIHDGVTGLWKQPYHGAKEGGMLGFIRGFGMGLGGFVLKDIAACIGPEAYLLKGLHEEYMKKYQPTNYLRRARIIQGQKELAELGPATPRRSGRYDLDHRTDGTKRRELEMLVSRKWEDLQPQIRDEMKHHRTGVRAALMGKSQLKAGRSMPRKSSKRSANAPHPPKKTPSAPIDEAGKFPEPDHWSEFNGEANGSFPKMERRSTAPMAATQWKEKAERKRKHQLDTIPDPLKQEAKEQGAAKHEVPNIFVDSALEAKIAHDDDRADSHVTADGGRVESL